MSAIIDLIRHGAGLGGMNLVAAIPVARYAEAVGNGAETIAALAGEARSIVIVGNGGRTLWEALQIHAGRNPGWWERDNPIDDFTVQVVEQMVLEPLRNNGLKPVAAYPFVGAAPFIDFMTLGRIAGLGGPSILGVLVNPAYGPWIAFRAAILIDADLDEPGAATGFDPCPGCATRPCIDACPPRAVSFPDGWSIPRCLEHRVEVEADCAGRCHARAGCVLGPEHRYPDAELEYHQQRALVAMRAYYLGRQNRR